MPLFNIKLTFDSTTEKISNIEIVKSDGKKQTQTGAATAAPVSLSGAVLQLNNDCIKALGIEVGDKLLLKVNGKSAQLSSSSKGNVLSEKLTITCRGKNQEALSKLGDKFNFVKAGDTIELIPMINFEDTDDTIIDNEVDDDIIEQLGDSLDDFNFNF